MNDSKQKRNVSEKRLLTLIKISLKYNLTRLKVGDVEFERNPSPPKIAVTPEMHENLKEDEKMPQGDEMLFYSTPSYDALLEEKQRDQK